MIRLDRANLVMNTPVGICRLYHRFGTNLEGLAHAGNQWPFPVKEVPEESYNDL